MKLTQVLLVTIALAAVALAGCADKAPVGEFSSTRSGLTLGSGSTVEIDIQEEENEYDPGGDPTGMIPFDQFCALDAVTDEIDDGPHCHEAVTTIRVHAMDLPDPGSGSYEVYLTGDSERNIGTLVEGAGGMWDLEVVLEGEDLSGQFNRTEVRYGSVVYAASGASTGENFLEINDLLRAATFTVTYTGAELVLEAQGLPEGANYVGWLVRLAEDPDHLESFPVTNGENSYTAQENIPEYDEVHVHIGDSKINLGIAVIPAPSG